MIKDSKFDGDRYVEVNDAFGKDSAKSRESAERCKSLYKGVYDCDVAFEMFSCFNKKN